MSKQDWLLFSGVGLAGWLAATIFYLAFGAALLETSFWFYVLNAALNAAALWFGFRCACRLRRTPRTGQLLPALAFSLPGLICGPLVLLNFTALSTGSGPESLGRYGAFLVVAYVAVVGSVLEPGQRRSEA